MSNEKHVAVPVDTLKYWFQLVKDNPQDLEPRIAKYVNEGIEVSPEQSAKPMDGSQVKGYRTLPQSDIDMMNCFKTESAQFLSSIKSYQRELIAKLNGSEMLSKEQAQEINDALRWLAIARTDMQTACMAACRAVAKPSSES